MNGTWGYDWTVVPTYYVPLNRLLVVCHREHHQAWRSISWRARYSSARFSLVFLRSWLLTSQERSAIFSGRINDCTRNRSVLSHVPLLFRRSLTLSTSPLRSSWASTVAANPSFWEINTNELTQKRLFRFGEKFQNQSTRCKNTSTCNYWYKIH